MRRNVFQKFFFFFHYGIFFIFKYMISLFRFSFWKLENSFPLSNKNENEYIEIISFVIALSDRTKNKKMIFSNSNTSPPATSDRENCLKWVLRWKLEGKLVYLTSWKDRRKRKRRGSSKRKDTSSGDRQVSLVHPKKTVRLWLLMVGDSKTSVSLCWGWIWPQKFPPSPSTN